MLRIKPDESQRKIVIKKCNCDEPILYHVYNFIITLLKKEYLNIKAINDTDAIKKKIIKPRKKIIIVTDEYFNQMQREVPKWEQKNMDLMINDY